MDATLWISTATGVGGIVLGGLLPYFLTERRTAKARYDSAIEKVTRVQALRHGGGGVSVPSKFVRPTSDEEHAKIEQELSVEGVRRWLDADAEARSALAALHPYSPDLQKYWDRFEIPTTDLDSLVKTLLERRRRPTRVHSG